MCLIKQEIDILQITRILKEKPRITGVVVAFLLTFSLCSLFTLQSWDLNRSEFGDSSSLEDLNEGNIDIISEKPVETPILPFSGFIENLGQINDDLLLYYYSTGGMTVGFAPSEIIFVINSPVTSSPIYSSLTFPGARKVSPIGYEMQAHYINYFYGEFQQTNIPTYGEIWYYDLYPGIDLRYYMSTEGLKYEFIVKVGAKPHLITIEASSQTQFIVEDQTVSFYKCLSKNVFLQDTQLKVYQQNGKDISAHFEAKGKKNNQYGIHLSPYDHSQPLIIDPLMLSFSTFFGGSGYDYVYDIVVDLFNNTYIIGKTNSIAFPVTPNALNSTLNDGESDLFVTKLDSSGNDLVFSTYLGGNGDDTGFGIAVDAYNNTYITGKTSSTDFPTTQNAINQTTLGKNDIFAVKLNSTGNRIVFSTYLGGSGDDSGSGIVVDAYNNSYITGETQSLNFPTTSVTIEDTHNGGTSDAFLVKVNAAGDTLDFSSYLGGGGEDIAHDITIDAYNNTYITGETWSSDFLTINAYDSTLWGNTDAFITKVNTSGGNLIFSTYLGGNGVDYGYGITVDALNNTYITGKTISSTFPLKDEYKTYSGDFDAFVTKLNSNGDGLDFSTYLGGTAEDSGNAIVVDSYDYIYVTGRTASENFIVTPNAYNGTHSGSFDAFVTKMHSGGEKLAFSTYLGGNGEDSGNEITVDNNNDTYVAGYTRSSNFPTYNAYSSSFGGRYDGFMTKLTYDDTPPLITLVSPAEGTVNNSGVVINVTIKDVHLTEVIFNWDGDFNQTWNEDYIFRLPYGDGEHKLYIYAYDRARNLNSKVFSFVTDNTPPKLFLRSPGQLIYPSIIVDIAGDAEHNWYYIEGIDSNNITWTSAVPREELDNGTYTLHAYGNDTIGNIVHTSVTFDIDTSFALVTIDSPVNGSSLVNSTTVTLSGDAVPMWYYISGYHDENQTYLPPITINLSDGTYTLHAFANNSIGNVTHVSVMFTIDTLPPSVLINSPLNSTITTGTVIVDLSGDADYYWYNIQTLPDNGFANQSWTATTQHNLINGTYILHAYGNDSAGNEAHGSVIFTIDTTQATVIIDSPINTTYANNTITVSLSGDAIFYLYRIPGVVDFDTLWTAPVSFALTDGAYILDAYGFKTGGKATYVNVTFVVDTTPPTVIIDSPLSTTYTIDNITINLSELSDAEHYWYYIAGVDNENQTWSSTTTRSSLPGGTYTLHVYGNDSVGNIAYTNATFIIETPIPSSVPSGTLTTILTNTTSTSTTISKPGYFPGFLAVLTFLVTSVILIRKRKKIL